MSPEGLDLSGVEADAAIYTARIRRDFGPLLSYLRADREITPAMRRLLIDEIAGLSRSVRKRPPPRLFHRVQAREELARIRRIIADPEFSQEQGYEIYEAYEDLARRLGVKGDFSQKGAATSAAKAVLGYIWQISPANLEKVLHGRGWTKISAKLYPRKV